MNIDNVKSYGGIYRIDFGEHTYIGSSSRMRQRIKAHRNSLVAGKGNHYLQEYYDKHGFDTMHASTIVRSDHDLDTLIILEQYFIDKYGTANLDNAQRRKSMAKPRRSTKCHPKRCHWLNVATGEELKGTVTELFEMLGTTNNKKTNFYHVLRGEWKQYADWVILEDLDKTIN